MARYTSMILEIYICFKLNASVASRRNTIPYIKKIDISGIKWHLENISNPQKKIKKTLSIPC